MSAFRKSFQRGLCAAAARGQQRHLSGANPNLGQQQHLLGALVSERCGRFLRARGGTARVLGLGLSQASIAQSLLSTLPPRANIVDIEQNEADMQPPRESSSRLNSVLLPSLDVLETVESRAALGLGDRGKFVCAVMAESLHDADTFTKRRTISFARSALDGGFGCLYILDRCSFDLQSPLADDHAALWDALHPTPAGGLPFGDYAAHLEEQAAERDAARRAAALKGRSLPMGSWDSPQQCASLCQEMGFHAEVIFQAFNRFLVAARPRPEADAEDERRRDFESWRDAKLTELEERVRPGNKRDE